MFLSKFVGGKNILKAKDIKLPYYKIYDYVKESDCKNHCINHKVNLLGLRSTYNSMHAIKLSGLYNINLERYLDEYNLIAIERGHNILIDAENVKNQEMINEYSNYCIYVGHCEIVDFETGQKAKGPPKIGKSRYLSALNRGRSQGGSDWIFDYIYFVPEEEKYSKLETQIHNELKKFNLNKPHHRELYNLSINDAIDKVKSIIESAF